MTTTPHQYRPTFRVDSFPRYTLDSADSSAELAREYMRRHREQLELIMRTYVIATDLMDPTPNDVMAYGSAVRPRYGDVTTYCWRGVPVVRDEPLPLESRSFGRRLTLLCL